MELNTYLLTYAFPPYTKLLNKETGQTAVLAGVMQLWKKDAIMYCVVVDGSPAPLWVDQMELLTNTSCWMVVEDGSAEGK